MVIAIAVDLRGEHSPDERSSKNAAIIENSSCPKAHVKRRPNGLMSGSEFRAFACRASQRCTLVTALHVRHFHNRSDESGVLVTTIWHATFTVLRPRARLTAINRAKCSPNCSSSQFWEFMGADDKTMGRSPDKFKLNANCRARYGDLPGNGH